MSELAPILERIAVALEEVTRIKREYADKMKALELETSPRTPAGASPTNKGLATPKQIRYIQDLSKKLGQFPGNDLSEMTVPEASAKIEELKAKVWGSRK